MTCRRPELLKKVKADPTVELASLNYKRYATAVPNDEFYGTDQAAYLNTVRMPQAWDLSKTTGSQIVAVLDTGVDAGHPDLVGHLVTGYNATSPNRGPIDDNGHGTMTLGIIAAAANNVEGVAGVGWNVKAMPVKVLASDGSGYDVDIAEGIDWAVAHGAKVINMSLGGPGDNPILHQAVSDAVNAGVTVVAAAGNDGSADLQYPASYTEAIAVAATDANGGLTDFSSFGDWVDIAAPGWDILSTGRAVTDRGRLPAVLVLHRHLLLGADRRRRRGAGEEQVPVARPVRHRTASRGALPGRRPARHRPVLRPRHPGRVRRPRWPVRAGLPDGGCGWQRPADPRQEAERLRLDQGAIDSEGDVDWYSVDLGTPQDVRAVVTGPSFDERSYSSNVGPVVDVYDVGPEAPRSRRERVPGRRPCHRSKRGPLTASVDVKAPAGSPVRCCAQLQRLEGHPAVHAERGEQRCRPVAATGPAYPLRDVFPANLSSRCAGVRRSRR